MPYSDPEKRKVYAREYNREYYRKRRESDPEFSKRKNANRDEKLRNDPEYREYSLSLARNRMRELCKDPEYRKQRNEKRKKAYTDNHAAYLVKAARGRARKLGIECNITEDDITIPETCPILGIPLIKGDGRPNDNSPNIDRIDPSMGYVTGNVWIISHRANRIKNNATLEELEKIVEALKWIKEN